MGDEHINVSTIVGALICINVSAKLDVTYQNKCINYTWYRYVVYCITYT